MLFNEINDRSISPIKSEITKTSFKTPTAKPIPYVPNPRIARIKDSYYLKTNQSKANDTLCNESRNDTLTSTNTSKFMSLRDNSTDKYEVKIKNIIDRRIILQNTSLKKDHGISKHITPEKRENHFEQMLNLTPVSRTENMALNKKHNENLEKRWIFTPNLLKEINDSEEKEDINFGKNQEKERVNDDNFCKNKEKESVINEEYGKNDQNINIMQTFRMTEKNILTEGSNFLIIKETNNDEAKLKVELLAHLEDIITKAQQEKEPFSNEEDFNYGYNLMSSLKKKRKELATSQEFRENCTKEAYLDGSIYYGNKSNNLKHGKGIYIDKNQQIYIGEFKNDKKDGFGILKDQNGAIIYEGQWKCNKYQGKGRLINFHKKSTNRLFNFRNMDTIQDNWNMYEGGFLNGVYNGMGVLTIDNSRKYKGEFKQGYIHGHGVIVDRGNPENKIDGDWRLNIYVSNLLLSNV